ncbi:hypothetical protein [Mesorhizobium kowhaii]|uniref:Uncharacterized protein n=1 Tax=Mesorhizobium kowhaii TaxID=1300272 RepID=A0A2W7CGJ9_9HYPH|nr:hypothetical protein [Mesorhizobium kowhaii]PZV40528.1 hypothetical protein B5V02_00430 [Mesorhizobium kowhaii]
MADYTLPYNGSNTLDLSNEANTDGNSSQTNDTITGSSGDDSITAGAATEQNWTTGSSAHPVVQVVQDNDTIIESQGTNNLTGGYGNDTFEFHLNLQGSAPTLHTEYYHDGAVPTQTSGANTNGVWNSYASNLEDWRAAMDALHGDDTNQDTTHVDYTYSSGKTAKTGSVDYDNSFSWLEGGGYTTNTSTNYIHDFGNGHDNIALDITADQFAAAGGTITTDGTDTTVHIGSFDIVVLGVHDVGEVGAHLNFASAV